MVACGCGNERKRHVPGALLRSPLLPAPKHMRRCGGGTTSLSP
ncbi:hypothetical protein HMPREF3190_01621 [Umbribacter vaginalis]|nr:hypothetical protein HMPREF3190_01621 [Coriobacteriales bacterium DNF00809]